MKISICRLFCGTCITWASFVSAGDLHITPLLDGERSEIHGEGLLNNWGGPFSAGNISGVSLQSNVVHSGNAAYRADLGTISDGGFGFFQTFSSGLASSAARRQTRDLTRFDSLDAYLRNDTGTPLNLKLEIKDYRDSLSHQAYRNFTLPANSNWTNISTSLDLQSGWSVIGSPEVDRSYVLSFVMTPVSGSATGSVYFDDVRLVEPGGVLDIQAAPTSVLAEQVARRQFEGLWSARSRTNGLIPNASHDVNLAAMNTTAGVLWMLPAAVRHGWIDQPDADGYVSQVAATLHGIINQTRFLPTRFVDLATANPVGRREESSIDAAFVALALHHYKSQPAISSALYETIDAVQNRFDFSAFATPTGFKLAHFDDTGFTGGTYDGYTHEGKVISLAAELSDDFHVPLEQLWNADTFRVKAHLVNPADAHLVHQFDSFRAPFVQALLNLFVDTSTRGIDNYPVRALATNPRGNFVRYQREVAARLQQLGRDHLFQPDAGQGGAPEDYRPYSLYNDFGQPELLMPWSASLALLAGADGADDALRVLLENGLHGPLGIADTARWATSANFPTDVPAYQDNWNVVLSTMALLEYLEGLHSSSTFFATIPEVDSALDQVYLGGDFNADGSYDLNDIDALATAISGRSSEPLFDLTGDGRVDDTDLSAWLSEAGAVNLPSGEPYLRGDANLDSAVDVTDFNIWNANKFTTTGLWSRGDFTADGNTDTSDFNVWNSNKFRATNAAPVPEPATLVWLTVALSLLVTRRRQGWQPGFLTLGRNEVA